MTRGSRHAVGAVLPALVAGATILCAGASAAASPATFTIRIDAAGRGTFAVRGAVVDSGRAVVRLGSRTGG